MSCATVLLSIFYALAEFTSPTSINTSIVFNYWKFPDSLYVTDTSPTQTLLPMSWRRSTYNTRHLERSLSEYRLTVLNAAGIMWYHMTQVDTRKSMVAPHDTSSIFCWTVEIMFSVRSCVMLYVMCGRSSVCLWFVQAQPLDHVLVDNKRDTACWGHTQQVGQDAFVEGKHPFRSTTQHTSQC